MEDLERRVKERQSQMLKIIEAVDLIVLSSCNRYGEFNAYHDGSGKFELKDFFNYGIKVWGNPFGWPMMRFRSRKLEYPGRGEREYDITKNRGRIGVVKLKFRDKPEKVEVVNLTQEEIEQFMPIALNLKFHIETYLAEKKKQEEEAEKYAREHWAEITEKKRQEELTARVRALKIIV